MEVHVRVAGPRLPRNLERMQALRCGKRVIEILIDALEVGDNRAAERRQPIENEKIGVAAGRELVIEEDIDAIGLAAVPGHLARQTVWRGRSGGDDVRRLNTRV